MALVRARVCPASRAILTAAVAGNARTTRTVPPSLHASGSSASIRVRALAVWQLSARLSIMCPCALAPPDSLAIRFLCVDWRRLHHHQDQTTRAFRRHVDRTASAVYSTSKPSARACPTTLARLPPVDQSALSAPSVRWTRPASTSAAQTLVPTPVDLGLSAQPRITIRYALVRSASLVTLSLSARLYHHRKQSQPNRLRPVFRTRAARTRNASC